ncbi:MFS transporter [Sphingobium phenoxybenzoativorans]|jgi:AAHS family 4-hydroxybenzoate transporter-like MFS transporter|uniref:MFS transporter n=1 Tax=Sphingobium phenoxybenzoativorans TaxID=1592790 RepID=A0A975K6D3_9SPHN|nr:MULTISPECIES: MFS transporter [Sphingobium]QUT05624.1 MFS transporter [Sphingobium phenoxybenzoativorans]WDA39280.1 MFS transporter [Sphingobium sp. YC-XJ3]
MTNIKAPFENAPMSRAQLIIIALTITLSGLDGYDVLSVTFAAPAIAQDWGVGRTALGIVLSAGLAGMAAGSFIIAPLADVFGRKLMVLIALCLMATGMLLCTYATSVEALVAWRVITGLGIGTCVAVINPIAAEFSNRRRRPLAIALTAVGYPLGGLVGALLATYLLRQHGWPSVFFSGFLAAVALLPLVAWQMPESVSYLFACRGKNRLERINAVLRRCEQPLIERLPERALTHRSYAAVFSSGQLSRTLWITAVNGLMVATVYYIMSWMPQMIADAGFPPSTASLVASVSSFMGVVGGLLFGWLAQRGGLRRLTAGGLIALGLATINFGATPPSVVLLVIAAGICGFCIFACASGVYITLASSFTDEARAAGSGFVIGVGRVVSAIAPSLAGLLFAGGFSRMQVCLFYGALSVVGGIVCLFGWQRFSGVASR